MPRDGWSATSHKDDFQVFEDGKRQTISSFTFVDIPVERPDRPLFQPNAIEPDIASNERPFDGRVYVLVLDDLHTAALRSQLVKNAARQFIQRNLGANDLMAVVYTGGRSDDNQEFTSNRRLLLAAVDKFMGQKLAVGDAQPSSEYYRQRDLVGSSAGLSSRTVSDPDDQERAMQGALHAVDHQERRRLVRRCPRPPQDDAAHQRRHRLRHQRHHSRLRSPPSSGVVDHRRHARGDRRGRPASNVSIYAVDPRGLTTLGDETIGVDSFADHDDPSAGIGLVARCNNELRLSQDSLRTLADETGGFAAVNTNQFADAFERIVSDNSSYYVLAYYPPIDTSATASFTRSRCKTTRPGLTVRSRKGYRRRAARRRPSRPPRRGKPSIEVMEALNSPIQVSGLRMRMFAAPFKGAAPNASVLLGVELVGRDLGLAAERQGRAVVLRLRHAGEVARRSDRQPDDQPASPTPRRACSRPDSAC